MAWDRQHRPKPQGPVFETLSCDRCFGDISTEALWVFDELIVCKPCWVLLSQQARREQQQPRVPFLHLLK